MIREWVLDILGNIPVRGIVTEASYKSKPAEKIPHVAKILNLELGEESVRIMVTDSDIKSVIDRPQKYTEAENLVVGKVSIQTLTQKSTLKTKCPRDQKLFCTIINYFKGESKLGVDSYVAEFTESQFSTCRSRYDKIKRKLKFKLTFKQKFAILLSWLFGIGGE